VGIVKVDVINQSLASIRKLISHPQLKGKTLLAEKVESQEMYEECLSLGFELFQGYYLERPKIVVGAQLNVGQQTMMNLLSNLCRSDITVSEVADLIATDPVLVIKIMKIINCPLYPYKREITHLREAVVKLGIEPVKQWAVIFSLVANSSQPSELFRVLLIRAKACELYAKIVYPNDFQEYFLVGLFSSLDAVLGVDKETLYKAVNLPSSITDKLAPTEAKNLPNILSMILSYEQGDSQLSSNGSNDVDEVNNAYWAGVMWADEIMQFLA
jgi:EAL and modified HD-GYP domain-containing signal transduction protein